MKRRLPAWITLVGALTLVTAGCSASPTAGDSTQPNSTSSGNATAKPRIFFTNPYYNAPYCVPLNAAAKQVAEKNNADLTIVDGEQSGQKQLDQIKTAISEKYDGIIYFPADIASSVQITKVLAESKIPFVTINSQVDPSVRDLVPAHAGTQEITHGHNIASAVKDVLSAAGGNIVIVEGSAGSSFTENVTKGIKEDLAGTNINILDKQNADFDAQKAMKVTEDFLTKYGDKINAIVSQDGGMLPGVLSALDAAGKKGTIPVLVAGSNQVIKDAIIEGSVYSTSTQDPGMEATLAIELLLKVINGEKVEKFNQIPMEVAKKEDVDKYNWF